MIRAFVIAAFAYSVIAIIATMIVIGVGLLLPPHDDDGGQE